MNKLITCMLILALSLSALGAGAFAADAGTVSMNFEEVGLAFELPEEFVKTKGILEPYPIGELASGITFMMFSYTAMTPDELKALEESEAITKEQEDALVNAMGNLAYVFSIDGGRNAGDILETLQIPTVTEADFTEIGKAEDVTFYLFLDKETDKAFLSGIAPEFAEEFTTLQSKLPEVLKAGTFSVPRPIGSELVGRVLRFETKDIDGNPVKSEDIFAKNEITMVNVWATWCGPCRSELEELGEIDRRLAAKNCAVVGICIDAVRFLSLAFPMSFPSMKRRSIPCSPARRLPGTTAPTIPPRPSPAATENTTSMSATPKARRSRASRSSFARTRPAPSARPTRTALQALMLRRARSTPFMS